MAKQRGVHGKASLRGATLRLTAVIRKQGRWFVALYPELDIASQGRSIAGARRNLAEAVELFFECADTDELRRRFSSETYVSPLEITVA